MTIAYVDTSCLVAVAFDEPGAREMRESLSRCDHLAASNLLEAELRAALVREGVREDPAALLQLISWIHPQRSLMPEFVTVLAHGYVKGADLWHLACACFLQQELPELIFLTLDQRQNDVATRLGLGG